MKKQKNNELLTNCSLHRVSQLIKNLHIRLYAVLYEFILIKITRGWAKLKQKIITPSLVKCSCGKYPEIIDHAENFHNLVLRFECKHHSKKFSGNYHKAVCRWNNYITGTSSGHGK